MRSRTAQSATGGSSDTVFATTSYRNR
jgi:hypothetical protein